MVSPALLQYLGGCLLQACIAGKNCLSSTAATLEWFPYPGLCESELSIGMLTAVTKAVVSLFCRAAQGKRPSTVCPALLQLLSGFPIQACVKGEYQYMSLQ